MKLLVLLTLVGFCTCQAAVSAQNSKITLSATNTTLASVFRQIEQLTDYMFIYKSGDIAPFTDITIDRRQTEVNRILDECLSGTGLSYTFKDNLIIIQGATQQAEEKKVNGKITDRQGHPLPGVTVMIKGTQMGVVTDANGKYTIALPDAKDIFLRFTFIGMKPQEIAYTGQKEINVTLHEEATEMDEVVVTGYQTIRKERMTGTTATITANQIAGRGLQSIDEILNSTISGLNMISSGRPGQDAQIQIRGVNSLTGSTEPMWIVDGMPLQGEIPNIQSGSTDLQATIFTTGIGNIAPDDIKSITVLKDAAATAIYGARAANGVIVVETKSGLSGKTRFNASVNVGITERPRNNIDMMNTAEKIQFEREIFYDQQGYIYTPGRVTKLLQQAAYGEISSDEAERRIGELAKINTDWFKEIYRTAISQQYNFSIF